jgi:hypothetical protein
MGTMIQLRIGRLEIDWGKNSGFSDHAALFQHGDLQMIPYEYANDIREEKEGLSKPLHLVADRLNLLGHTLKYAQAHFGWEVQQPEYFGDELSFEQIAEGIAAVDPDDIQSGEDKRHDTVERYIGKFIYPRLALDGLHEGTDIDWENFDQLSFVDPYTLIQLFNQHEKARHLPVNWEFTDIVEQGYAERDFFIRPLDRTKKLLIVTEGSSDAKIIAHAFKLLRPHIADFFTFVDMEEGYPFTGTGNLVNFVKGLVSIDVHNDTIIVFDNDAEGVASYRRCQALNLPSNMCITKLPDLPEFMQMRTVGPSGEFMTNINGRAAAIECYLDLDANATIRWNMYNSSIDAYHGALNQKDEYKKIFLTQVNVVEGYNYDKINKLLQHIVSYAVSLREGKRLAALNTVSNEK